MITLLFSTVGLTFEVKGIVPNVKPDCFLELNVIGFGIERLNMALIYCIRELNPEEYKNYKAMIKDFNADLLRKKLAAGEGFN